jgi:hypothetical protein
VDEYDYDRHHRPTFPYEFQWEQFQGMQRVRFWMWMFVGILSILMFGLDIWQSFRDGVGRDFTVGVIFGFLVPCLTFSLTRPRVMRWLMRLGKREGD